MPGNFPVSLQIWMEYFTSVNLCNSVNSVTGCLQPSWGSKFRGNVTSLAEAGPNHGV